MQENTDTPEVTIKASSSFMKLVKTHGLLIAVLIGGLYIRNEDLNEIKAHNTLMEGMLFDCYEKRIETKTSTFYPGQSTPSTSSTIIEEFVPPYKKSKYGYTLV